MSGKILWVVLFAAACCSGNSNFRPFTVSDGRVLEARLVSYNPAKGRVVMQRSGNRKSIPVSITTFSAEDQTYIEQWHAAIVFGNSMKMKLALKDEQVRKSEEGETGERQGRRGGNSQGKGNNATGNKSIEHRYDLYINNQTEMNYENIEVEYRIFYKRAQRGGGGGGGDGSGRGGGRNQKNSDQQQTNSVAEEITVGGTDSIQTLENKEKKILPSRSITLGGRSESKIIGAWYKLRIKGPDGDLVERNISMPPGLSEKKAWVDQLPAQREPRREKPGG